MEEKELAAYRKAGKIAAEVREWSRGLIREGAKALDVAEKTEKKIISLGGEIAFPLNVCINDVAAHYTPKFDDALAIGGKDIVTIDLGVHVDGYIADTAYTIDLSGKYKDMLEANQKALDAALELVRPGAKVAEIGKAVQETITAAGYRPIENLTGHEVKQYDLHAGMSIPNIDVPYDWELSEGMVLAIEPFATDGVGRVVEANRVEIFSLQEMKPTRMREGRILLNEIEKRKGLPFAERWLAKKVSPLRLGLIMRTLVMEGILHPYPILHEKDKGMVSQFEHTIIVTEDGGEVTTR